LIQYYWAGERLTTRHFAVDDFERVVILTYSIQQIRDRGKYMFIILSGLSFLIVPDL